MADFPAPAPASAHAGTRERASAAGGLAAMQKAFATAMAGQGDEAAAESLSARAGPRASTRLDIYRNNIASALTRALEGLYPALARLVGADFFARLARDYARAHPPAHGRLLEYGFGLPGFVAGYQPAGGYPWLADVGRLELAWHRAYLAAEASPLKASDLAAVPPERMAALELVLHPSCQRLASRYPVSAVWRVALDEDEPETSIEIEGGAEWILVVRPGAEVEVRTLTESGFVFLDALAEGRTLGAAYESACAVDAEFDLQGHLAGLLAGETFAGFRLAPEAQSETGEGD